ncbi:phosphoadenosine phosphosulfate reductase domain-containing protein [Saccharicrinis sp. GN24d3]|uniref:phosphoadenosine phosphosulfate reductase domain-containing protein n=1 Tax=Saccharicrinis sp. GN24d3 TaxID=3458416 RepID=UPI004035AFF8
MLHTTEAEEIESSRIEIEKLFSEKKNISEYDAIVCFSGGKDSTYTLKLAKEKYNLNVLSFTLDNGFISPAAFKNIEKVVSKLGIDHITYRPSYKFMKGLYRVSSLENIYNPKTLTRISANCNSCISIVNITALRIALEKNIPFILAGFTLGQIPSNTIYYQNNYKFFEESRKPILDKLKSRLGDDVSRYMEISKNLVEQSQNYPFNINLLCLEDITENEIVEKILPLGWKKPGDVDGCSTNCRINAFNNYVHTYKFGYSPYELELSHLIRKNLLSREEAMDKLLDQPQDQINFAKAELNIDDSMLLKP